MRRSVALRPLFVLVVGLLPLLAGWRPEAPPQATPPPGCAAVFAATSRGGGQPPPGSACSLQRGPTPKRGESATVRRVVDGDTVVLTNDERVRYIGIDTPEDTSQVEPFGPEATEFNERLVEGLDVGLEKDESERDRYGRLLRYVWVGDVMVNAELVREGYAEAREYLPDTRYTACFEALEAEARAEGRGMWAVVTPTPRR